MIDMSQLVGCHLMPREAAGSFPAQGTCQGCQLDAL